MPHTRTASTRAWYRRVPYRATVADKTHSFNRTRPTRGGFFIGGNMTEFRVVRLSPALGANDASRKNTLTSRICEALPCVFLRWFHFSLLRQVLLESRSALGRISLSQRRRTVLNYAEVRQSLPQVSRSDSRNEMQFCSASIQKLSSERPYLCIADMRLFAEGFLQAEKWYAHVGRQCGSEEQESCAVTNDNVFVRSAQSPVRMARESAPDYAAQPHPAFRSGAKS
jgi:hypothetical protein